MQSLRRKLLFPVFSLIVGTIAVEIILQIVALAAPKHYALMLGKAPPMMIKDQILGARGNPDFPDHDKDGFRNQSVPSQVVMVALGDSQTYGTGVKREEAWPKQMEALSKQPVYSMSCGGWGPTQSLLLFNEAIALHPKVIIEAFYDGNDLYDSFASVYYDQQLADLKTTDQSEIKLIREAEERNTLKNEVDSLFGKSDGPAVPEKSPKQIKSRVKEFLGKHIRIYQLLKALMDHLRRTNTSQDWETRKRIAESEKDKEFYQIIDQGNLKTILTPEYRLFALNLSDHRLVEGHRIAMAALNKMKERSEAAHIQFIVMLIPTKELVFQDVVFRQPGAMSKTGQALVENEVLVRQKTASFLNAHGIHSIDVLPALKAQVESGVQPYPMSQDGHPNAIGHRASLAALKGFDSLPMP